jgi:4-hydroxybenzoate polyprenyltransferase
MLTTLGFASMGYFINDFFDKKADKIAGKINYLSLQKSGIQLLLFMTSLLIAFFPWIWLPSNNISWFLIAIELMFFLLYSLPFPRLKNVPYLSGIIDSSYAYVIPLLLVFHTCSLYAQQAFAPFIVFFAIGVFFIGFRNITIHHVNDISKDLLSGTVTLPQKIGSAKTNSLILVLLLFEIVLIFISSFLIAKDHPFFFCWLLFYCSFVAIRFIKVRSSFELSSPFIDKVRHLTDVSYQVWFPLITLLLATTVDWRWILLSPFHVILLIPSYHLKNVIEWMLLVWDKFKTYFFFPAKHFISHIINYSIFYFFLLFGVNLRKEKKSAWRYLKSLFDDFRI